jgi:hypothetical protein
MLLAACLPAPTELVGKECDPQHECGRGLFCVAGRCAVEPATPVPVPAPAPMPMPMPVPDAGSVTPMPDAGAPLCDCANPACDLKPCDAANPAAVCCGTSCRDLSSDPLNCGMCGGACATGQTCRGVAVGSIVSGRCSCTSGGSGGSGDAQCPALVDDQSCEANHCSCDEDSECAPTQRCARLGGGSNSPGICHY